MKLSKKRLLDRRVCITVSHRQRHNSAKVKKTKRYQMPTFAVANFDFWKVADRGRVEFRHLLPPKTLQKIVPPTLGDLRCVAQRIHYVKRKGSDSVQDRTE